MNKEISPEERLFNAIQDGKKSPVSQKPNPPAFWGKMMGGMFSKEVKRPAVPLNLPSGGGNTESPGIKINLKIVNGILFLILGALVSLVGYNIFGHRSGVPELAQESLADSGTVPVLSSPQDFMPMNDYLQEVEKRDIFHPIPPPAPRVPLKAIKPPQAPQVDLHKLIKDLSLSGIYQGADTEAMIEDKTAKKTYFLKVGDQIRSFKIKSILSDRVILQMGNDKVELL